MTEREQYLLFLVVARSVARSFINVHLDRLHEWNRKATDTDEMIAKRSLAMEYLSAVWYLRKPDSVKTQAERLYETELNAWVNGSRPAGKPDIATPASNARWNGKE